MEKLKLTSREPLVVRGAIVAAITAVIHVGVVLGLLPLDKDAEQAIAGAVDLAGTAVIVFWSRGAVTPMAQFDPTLGEDDMTDPEGPQHLAHDGGGLGV